MKKQTLNNLCDQQTNTIKPILLGLLAAAMIFFTSTPVVFAATLEVDRFDDVLAGATACTAAANDCSLRGAISNANDNAGADTINLPAGTYTLSLTGSEDDNVSGDLDITDTNGTLTIIGATAPTDATPTIIQAGTTNSNGIDRVFDVLANVNVTFESLTIRHGKASSDDGGGIRISSGTVILTDVAVSDNSTDVNFDGGGIRIEGGSLTITGSTISGNNSADFGGGLYIHNSAMVNIINSTVSGNTSVDDGGGVGVTFSSNLTMNNVTIANNSAGSSPGGGIDVGSTNTSLIIKNSIIADNTADSGPDCFVNAAYTVNFSILETACSGTGTLSGTSGNNLNADPGLGALADNGGPTETHAITIGSNAFDSGDPAGTGGTATGGCLHSNAVTNINVDQRGAARAQGVNKGGSACDRGAFEVATQTPTAVTLQSLSVNTTSSLLILLTIILALLTLPLLWWRFQVNQR